jgi:methylenetetrahydrofolate dehydrogenase (NADP+)/methenyltetrahydrofolate cyclohydrolase
MLLLQGKPVADRIYADLKQKIQKFNLQPHLVVVLVGDDPASQVYVSHKQKACALIGFRSTLVRLPAQATEAELENQIKHLNSDLDVDAILLQLPLPKHLSAKRMTNLIAPEKDADSLTHTSLGRLVASDFKVVSCTPAGIVEMFKHYKIELTGQRVLVVGRSLIVGIPLFHLLTQQDATVTLAHSKTEDLKELIKQFDIVIVAAGKPHFLKVNDFKKNAVVIDVGIHRAADGLTGDVNPEGAEQHLRALSPVPGGVGPLTIAMLMKNTFTLACARAEIS